MFDALIVFAQLEEERVHMQTKIWEMSWESEKQFEQLHKLETRYNQLQQHYEQLRQDHRYCQPVSSLLTYKEVKKKDSSFKKEVLPQNHYHCHHQVVPS